MFRRSSDMAERLPAYNDIMSTAQRAVEDGAFDGLDPAIPNLLEGAIPTGLRPDNRLEVPKSYNPEDGPLVLVLRPDEKVTYTSTRAVSRSVQRVIANVGLQTPKSYKPGDVDGELVVGQKNHVSLVEVPWEKDGIPRLAMRAPVLVAVTTDLVLDETIPSTMGHELDHWDFFLHPTISYDKPASQTSDDHLLVASERRAYASSYQIERNMGQHVDMPTPAELAAGCDGMDPEEAGRRICSTFIDAVQENLGLPVYPHSLAAVAIAHLFADPEDGSVTSAEVAAYKGAGYIDLQE